MDFYGLSNDGKARRWYSPLGIWIANPEEYTTTEFKKENDKIYSRELTSGVFTEWKEYVKPQSTQFADWNP